MNIPYDLLHKWAKNSNNDKGGPKMSSHEQQKIADITKKRKYKVLYRGTFVSNKNNYDSWVHNHGKVANELVAVAKTNRPIQKTQNTDMTFVVKLDL